MKSIGFKNFRRFHDFPEIDLGRINLLVGGNNSGKSTLVKALLLCADNLKLATASDGKNFFSMPQFRFDANEWHDVKIKTFGRALSSVPATDESGATILPSQIEFSFRFEYFDIILRISGDPDKDSPTGDIRYVSIRDWRQQRQYIVDYDNNTMTYVVLGESCEPVSAFDELQQQLKEAQEKLEALSEGDDFEAISRQNDIIADLQEKIKNLIGSDSEQELVYSGRVTVKSLEQGSEEWEKVANSHTLIDDLLSGVISRYEISPIEDHPSGAPKNFFLHTLSMFETLEDHEARKKEENSENDDSETDSEVSEESENRSELKKQEAKPTLTPEEERMAFARKFILSEKEIIRRSKDDLDELVGYNQIEYITAHAANQNTLYNTSDRDDVNAITVHEFFKSRIFKGEAEYNFIKSEMKRFGIGEDFDIESVGGEAYRITIHNFDGSKVNLADKGMGSIQLMMLILRLATIIRTNNLAQIEEYGLTEEENRGFAVPTILIEEPEQNLHPAVQSKLAELLYEFNKHYYCPFVIETHSEYLIRKTQVLVAGENYADEKDLAENNPFRVYYFNAESGKEPCYQLEYRTDGVFANDFGEGFFDESEKLAFQIL